MSYAEYRSWVEYSNLEPFGPYYEDLRAGQIAAAICNANRDVKVRSHPIMPSELVRWNAFHAQACMPQKPIYFDDLEKQSAAIESLFCAR